LNIERGIEQLLAAKAVYDRLGITFWLSGGTLLGAIREGGLMKWDSDIDLTIMADDYSEDLVKEMEKSFVVTPIHYGLGRTTVFDLNHKPRPRINNFLAFHVPKQKLFVRVFPPFSSSLVHVIPEKYFLDERYVEMLGTKFRVYSEAETVLASQYGDWKTRVEDGFAWKDNWPKGRLSDYSGDIVCKK